MEHCDSKIETLFKKGKDEAILFYEKWAENGEYDQDMNKVRCVGPNLTATVLAKYFTNNRSEMVVLDVAAGTGMVGVELYKRGFHHLDALDPCRPMLEMAKEKGVYENMHCCPITGQPLDIKSGSYDAIVSTGAIADGHLPAESLYEMTRLIRSGGVIVIVGNLAIWRSLPEYNIKMKGIIKELEKEGKITLVKEEIHDNYRFSKDSAKAKGVVVVLKRL